MIRRAAAFALALFAAAPAAAFDCHTAIVFGLDASRSVDSRENRLQREGLAAALVDRTIIEAILPYPGAGVAAMAFEWSNPEDQVVIAPWTVLDTPEAVRAFAARIPEGPTIRRRWKTGIGPAMRFAAEALAAAPVECRRLVVDISGDGPGNAGAPPAAQRAVGVLDGIVFNGLVIRNPLFDGAQPPGEDPLVYYNRHVIQGPGAFVEVASSYDDYPPAIRRKLLRELSPPIASR
ncbi:MAG: DUF1194 domain-containing protein [Pseudomonadota bacterium]